MIFQKKHCSIWLNAHFRFKNGPSFWHSKGLEKLAEIGKAALTLSYDLSILHFLPLVAMLGSPCGRTSVVRHRSFTQACVHYFSVAVAKFSHKKLLRKERDYCGLQLQGDRVHASEEGLPPECEAGSWLVTFHPHATSKEQEQEVRSGYKPSKIPTLWHTCSKVPPLKVSVSPQAEPRAHEPVVKFLIQTTTQQGLLMRKSPLSVFEAVNRWNLGRTHSMIVLGSTLDWSAYVHYHLISAPVIWRIITNTIV